MFICIDKIFIIRIFNFSVGIGVASGGEGEGGGDYSNGVVGGVGKITRKIFK